MIIPKIKAERFDKNTLRLVFWLWSTKKRDSRVYAEWRLTNRRDIVPVKTFEFHVSLFPKR